jgi:chemotaxis protein methyltransferase CheR
MQKPRPIVTPTAEEEREFAFMEENFRQIKALVHERTGIALNDHKKNMVYSRLARRVRAMGLEAFDDYLAYLLSSEGDGEIIQFVNAITTNLTHFFRENHHFEHLRQEVLSPLLQNPPAGKRLRIWSAGCSAGAEPYSIAICLMETLGKVMKSWDCRILATDIDTNMLDKGAQGIYSAEFAEKIPPAYRQRYTTSHSHGQIEMQESLKRLIAFKRLNLLESWPMRGLFDVIFCRNVVIYFDKDTQRILFERFANHLKPDGWLYIGHSESLHNVSDRFRLTGRTTYQKIR